MIEATKKKLRETKFFLTLIDRQHLFGEFVGSIEESEFLVSAFLSAARSVTFVLKAEEPDRYKSWWDAWNRALSDDDKAFLRRLKNARNRAVKRDIPPVEEDLSNSFVVSGDDLTPAQLFLLSEEGDLPLSPRVLKVRLQPSDEPEAVLSLCRRYEALLSKFLNEIVETRG